MGCHFNRWIFHISFLHTSVWVLVILTTTQATSGTSLLSGGVPSPNAPLPTPPALLSGGVPSPNACGLAGQSRVRRVVNGWEAGRCRYPWMALIDRGGSPSDTCGATLVTDRHIITAAHCFDKLRSRPTVVIGEYNRTELNAGSEHRTTKYSVSIHPGYSNVIYRNDIAVVTLDTPLDLSQYECLRPICLPEEQTPLLVETRCAVAGWGSVQRGRVEHPKVSNVLRTTLIQVVEPLKCHTVWSRLFYPDTHICAGDLSGRTDSCEGDSGGPLMCHDTKGTGKVMDTGKYFLFGVVSLGNTDCAKPEVPAMYTDVRKYLPWIRKTMSDSE